MKKATYNKGIVYSNIIFLLLLFYFYEMDPFVNTAGQEIELCQPP